VASSSTRTIHSASKQIAVVMNRVTAMTHNNPLAQVPGAHVAFDVGEVPAIEVGPGCLRRDLPGLPGIRAWVVDMAPGSEWPHVDHHQAGEGFYVISGEVIEGGARYRAGTYVSFAPDSGHRPRTDSGVRLLGFNPLREVA
jgi:hypothetical protein